MRIRQVKPEFWSDHQLLGLEPGTKLFYIGLWCEADDSGYLRWHPEQLALDLMHDIPRAEAVEMITRFRRELEDRRRIRVFRCGHAVIPTLPKNQHLAGSTKRVYTFAREHEDCRRRKRGIPTLAEIRTDQGVKRATARRSGESQGSSTTDLSVDREVDARGSPRIPADARPVRLGKVSDNSHAGAGEAEPPAPRNGADPVQVWGDVLRNGGPTLTPTLRSRAESELERLGYRFINGEVELLAVSLDTKGATE